MNITGISGRVCQEGCVRKGVSGRVCQEGWRERNRDAVGERSRKKHSYRDKKKYKI